MKQKLLTAPVTIKAWRYEPVDTVPGTIPVRGTRSVPDGTRTALVELWIDVDALLQDLGAKALRSKSKKSTLHAGDIEAHVVVASITRNGGTV